MLSALLGHVRRLEAPTRPADPEMLAALRRRWEELPGHVKHPAQLLGRRSVGCEGTHGGVWLFYRDCLTWETSGSAVGLDTRCPLPAEHESRLVANQPLPGTTILPAGSRRRQSAPALVVRNSPLNSGQPMQASPPW